MPFTFVTMRRKKSETVLENVTSFTKDRNWSTSRCRKCRNLSFILNYGVKRGRFVICHFDMVGCSDDT